MKFEALAINKNIFSKMIKKKKLLIISPALS